jgi:hypothetical protein
MGREDIAYRTKDPAEKHMIFPHLYIEQRIPREKHMIFPHLYSLARLNITGPVNSFNTAYGRFRRDIKHSRIQNYIARRRRGQPPLMKNYTSQNRLLLSTNHHTVKIPAVSQNFINSISQPMAILDETLQIVAYKIT